MLYGPDYPLVQNGQVPTSSDVAAWLQKQRKNWPFRKLAKSTTINEITAWARAQGLKRLDWDFVPKQKIWFRDPQVAMMWDLTCSQKTTEVSVDNGPIL
jgi:hypothetical protein